MLKRRSLLACTLAVPSVSAFAQFRVEISGVGATQLPIAIPRFRDEERAPAADLADRARRPRAQRLLPHRRRRRRGARRDEPAVDGRLARQGRRRARGRLAAAPGRRPLRRALQALGRRQGRRPGRPGERGGPGRPAPGSPPHRRLHLREADRRQGRVLDPHRLRDQGRRALHAARRRCRRRRRAGRAEQPRADHLAGLVARRRARSPTSRSRARRRSSTRRTC